MSVCVNLYYNFDKNNTMFIMPSLVVHHYSGSHNDSDNHLHDSGNDNDHQVLPAPQYCALAPLHLLAWHLQNVQNFS